MSEHYLSNATAARLHRHFEAGHMVAPTDKLVRNTADAVGDIAQAILELAGKSEIVARGVRWFNRAIVSQSEYLGWALDIFPREQVIDRRERAIRFLEEAQELAQTQGVTEDDNARLGRRVWSRPVGEVWQEIGGAQFCLFSLAENLGMSAISCAEQDLFRVKSMDPEHFRRKNAEKVVDGVTFTSTTLKEHP